MSESNIFLSKSTEETFNIGRDFAEKLELNTILVLTGDLGAGKTVFAKGLAKGLGIKSPVQSPTYVIVRSYERFNHIDAYRLSSALELDNLGIDFENSITVIEWGEKFLSFLQNSTKNFITVEISKKKENKEFRKIFCTKKVNT